MTKEPSLDPGDTQSHDTRLAGVLQRYMADRRLGTAADHEQILAAHPEIAEELKSCLEEIDLLGHDAAQPSEAQPSEAQPSEALGGRNGDSPLGGELGRAGWSWAALGGLATIVLVCIGWWFCFVFPTLDDAQLQMTTGGSGLRADMMRLDGYSEPVSAAVPTTEPIVLDGGQWKARLLQPGAFSLDVRHWLEPGDDWGIMVPSPSSPIWSVGDVIHSAAARFEDGTDVLIITSSTIERRDGETGDVVWSRNSEDLRLQFNNGNPYQADWAVFPNGPKACFAAAPISVVGEYGTSIQDINGDGQGDFLLASFSQPAILALSGADGSTLWVTNYAQRLQSDPVPNGMRCLWIDAGSDGEAIAMFTSNRGAKPKFWAVRIDVTDGSMRWKIDRTFNDHRFNRIAVPQMYPVRTANRHHDRNHVQRYGHTFVQRIDRHQDWMHDVDLAPLISQSDRQLHFALDDDLVIIDRVSGGETVLPNQFSGLPAIPVQALGRNDQAERYFVATQENSITDLTKKERLRLTCYNHDFSEQLWERAVRADSSACVGFWTGRPRLPMVADLNHDGNDEIVVQVDRTDLPVGHYTHQVAWTDLQVIDGDGGDLLPSPVRIPNADLQLLHVQVVDDKDDDGWDDLVVATRYLAARDERGAVHVELIGSRTGNVIWRQRLEFREASKDRAPPEIHLFERRQIAGQEVLLLGIFGDIGFDRDGRYDTAILETIGGRILSIGTQLSLDAVLDESSDRPILWCVDRMKKNRDPNNNARAFSAFRFPEANDVHVAEVAMPVADIDGDGLTDLSIDRVSRGVRHHSGVISAASGFPITPAAMQRDGQEKLFALGFDLTGNGKDDYLGVRQRETLRLFEGGTRVEKWTLGRNLFIQQSPLAVIPAAIVSPDSRDLILVTYGELAASPTFGIAPWKTPLLVIGIRGSDGEVLWTQDYGIVASTGQYDRLNFAHGDLNGDATTDFVFSYFNDARTGSMFALNGRDGRRLWEIPDIYLDSTNWLSLFPKPVILATGNDRRIAFLGPDMQAKKNQDYRLVTADSKGRILSSQAIVSRHTRSTQHAIDGKWGRHEIIPLATETNEDPRFAFWVMNDSSQVEIQTRKLVADSVVEAHPPWTLPDDNGIRGQSWKQWFRILSANVDNDASDELILATSRHVAAYETDGRMIWSHPIDAECAVMETVRRVGDRSECIYSVTGENQRISFFALDVTDGSPRWSLVGREFMQPIGGGPVRGMIGSAALPTFAFADVDQSIWMTVGGKPSPGVQLDSSKPSTNEVAIAATPAAVPSRDTRLLGPGPYPGDFNPPNFSRRRFSGQILWSLVWSIFAILLPAILLLRIAIRRQFSLFHMMSLTAVLSVFFAVLTVPVASQVVSISDRLQMGLSVTPLLIWLLLLVAFYRRGPWFALPLLLALPVVLLGFYEIINLALMMPNRVIIPSDLLRLWRGLFITIPATAILGGPLWAALWFHRGRYELR